MLKGIFSQGIFIYDDDDDDCRFVKCITQDASTISTDIGKYIT